MTNLWLNPRRLVNFTRTRGDICQPLHMDQRRTLPTSRTRTTWWHEDGSDKFPILLDNTVRGQPGSTSGKTSRISRTTACHCLGEESCFSRKRCGLESFDTNLTHWPKVYTWTNGLGNTDNSARWYGYRHAKGATTVFWISKQYQLLRISDYHLIMHPQQSRAWVARR